MDKMEKDFQNWLDGTMCTGIYAETRRVFVQRSGANIEDIRWAFMAGHTYGQFMMEKK